jgi:hypothetical protein
MISTEEIQTIHVCERRKCETVHIVYDSTQVKRIKALIGVAAVSKFAKIVRMVQAAWWWLQMKGSKGGRTA